MKLLNLLYYYLYAIYIVNCIIINIIYTFLWFKLTMLKNNIKIRILILIIHFC